MNPKQLRTLLPVVAVAAVGMTLLGSSYTQTQISAQTLDVNSLDLDALQAISEMGGIRLNMPEAFAQMDCGDVDTAGRDIVDLDLTGESVMLPIMGHTADEPKMYQAMTFNGQVPGPTVRVTQGDVIRMTLTIPADEAVPHGNDMHSSQMSATNFDSVNPGESKTYCYIAHSAGVFKYHCSGVNVALMDQHVLSGMYGIAIVDPLDGYKRLMVEKTEVRGGEVVMDRQFHSGDALEFQLQYNQLYLDENGGYDQKAMFAHQNTATVVNGMQFAYVPNETHNELILDSKTRNIFVAQPWNSADLGQYQSQLLFVEAGQHVRFFVENQGNEPVFWHVVGEIIDRVTQGNRVQSGATETWLLGGSQNMIADIVFDEPGVYVAVNHDYAAIFSGAATIIVVGDPFGLVEKHDLPSVASYAHVLGNPSSAVPPMGDQSIEHPMINLHGLYTDERAAEIKAELGIA